MSVFCVCVCVCLCMCVCLCLCGARFYLISAVTRYDWRRIMISLPIVNSSVGDATWAGYQAQLLYCNTGTRGIIMHTSDSLRTRLV